MKSGDENESECDSAHDSLPEELVPCETLASSHPEAIPPDLIEQIQRLSLNKKTYISKQTMLLLFCYLFCIIIMSISNDINVCGLANVLSSCIVLLLILHNNYLSIMLSMFYRHKSLFA